MSSRPDIAVHDHDHQLQLTVEVKAKRGASAEWAARIRRNLLAHGMVPNAPYFLLALPDAFYFWRHADTEEEIPPEWKIDAAEALAPYVDRQARFLSGISEYGLELLVTSWLQGLVNSDLSPETAGPGLRWLFDSGLYEAIKNGCVATEAAV